MDLFQHELESAVKTLQAQVASLESRVAALEAGQVSEPLTEETVTVQEVITP